jgi:hypothetical protein
LEYSVFLLEFEPDYEKPLTLTRFSL